VNQKTILVVGGGYAGLSVVDSLRKTFRERIGKSIRLVLLDKEPYHFKKVRLVQAPREKGVPLRVPFSAFGWDDVERLQGELTGVEPDRGRAIYTRPDGKTDTISFDRLVLAVGSVVRHPPEGSEGFALRNMEDAEALRDTLRRVGQRASPSGRKSEPLCAAVVGGGITGIETAAELAYRLREEAVAHGMEEDRVLVRLIDAGQYLFPEAGRRVAHRLEKRLKRMGVEVLHGVKALRCNEGIVHLDNGKTIPAQLCVWALGVEPNPLLRRLGLPLHDDGRLLVDPWYRVKGHETLYAIGDCARVTDPKTGKPNGMTCKEGIVQARRLAEIIRAQMDGLSAPAHTSFPSLCCIGLGPKDGFIWARKWGVDFILTGHLGMKVREYTWNAASLMK